MKAVQITSADFLNTKLDRRLEFRFGKLEYDFKDTIADAFTSVDGTWNVTVYNAINPANPNSTQKIGFVKSKKAVISFINKWSYKKV